MVDVTAGATPAEMPRKPQALKTRDGRSLKDALHKSQRVARRRAFYLVLPILLFLLITFVFPLLQFISRSVYNPEVADFLPHVTSA